MQRYAALVDVHESEIRNVQDLASLWGAVQGDLEDVTVEVHEAYAVLGDHDFLLVYDAPDRDSALQAAVVAERYGMELKSMELVPVDKFGELVDDL